MRKFAFLLLLMIVIVLLAPFTMGKYLQYDIQNQLKFSQFPDGAQVTLTQYQTGWLTSHATFNVTTKIPKVFQQYFKLNANNPAKSGIQTFTVKATITNGPILFTKNLKTNKHWYIGKGLLNCMIEGFKVPVDITALLNFDNSIDANISLPQFDYTDHTKNIYFQMGNSNSYIKANGTWDHFDARSEISFISYIKKSTQIYMSDISSHSSLHQANDHIWLSNRSSHIPVIIVSHNKKALFNMTHLQMNVNQQYADKHISSEMNLSLQKIIYGNNKSIGPAIFKFTVQNIDPSAASQLKVISQQKGNKIDAEWKQAFANFIKGIQVNLTMGQINTPKGPINFSGMIQFPQTLPTSKTNPLLLQMMQNAHSQYTVKVAEKTLKDFLSEDPKDMKFASNLLDTFMKNGYVKNDNGQLTTTFEYQKGHVLINGLPPTKVTMEPGPVIVQPKTQSTVKTK